MSKEYIQALDDLFGLVAFQKSLTKDQFTRAQKYFDIIEQALQRLEAIDNANPSGALECLEKITDTFGCDMAYYHSNSIDIIKQALLELKAIKEANPNEALEDLKMIRDFSHSLPMVRYLEMNYALDTIQENIIKAQEQERLLKSGDLSDGYHTFNQLYFQRCILFASLVRLNKDKSWKSFKHSDGKYCFNSNGEWFIVGIDTPIGSYTYHYEKKYWGLFECQELECGKEWDGHTEEDVTRLLSLPNEQEKVLGILFKKNVNIKALKHYLATCDNDVALKIYNSNVSKDEELTQEEFELVKRGLR